MKAPTKQIFERDGINAARKYLVEAKIPEAERQLINDYLTALLVGDGNKVQSPLTVKGAIYTVKSFAEMINKPLRSIEKQDITNFLASKKQKGRSPATIGFYAIRLRQFFKWLDNGVTDKIAWIKKVKTKRDIQESDLFTPSEIKRMISIGDNLRDKALISGLYDSACRISEWLNVRIKDLIFDDYGAKVKVTGKTGTRIIRLIDSVPYLAQWINNHPFKDDKEAFIFFNFSSNHYGSRMFMGTAGIKLRTYAKRAKITKYIHPHLLRHSRLTWLAQREGFNERDLRIFAGWSSSSEMPDTYLHYGAEEVDKKLRKAKGLETEKETKNDIAERISLEPRICPRCEHKNPATALYCNCGTALDIKTVIEDTKQREGADAVMNELFQDNEFKDVIKEFMRKKMNKTPELIKNESPQHTGEVTQ
jgi:integrase